jgi:hypothetical protein
MEADVKSKYLVSMGDKKHISFWPFNHFNNGLGYSQNNLLNRHIEIKQNNKTIHIN